MDIEQKLTESIKEYANSGKVEELINKRIEESFDKIISGLMDSWGPLHKAIKSELENHLTIDLKDMPFEKYRDSIQKVVKAQIDGRFSTLIEKELNDDLATLMAEYPKEIKLSKLLSDFQELAREDASERGAYAPESCTIKVDVSDYDEATETYYLSLDEDDVKEKYGCKYRLFIYKGEVSNVTIDGDKYRKQLFIGPSQGFARFLFHAYVNKVKVIKDIDFADVDNYTYIGNNH